MTDLRVIAVPANIGAESMFNYCLLSQEAVSTILSGETLSAGQANLHTGFSAVNQALISGMYQVPQFLKKQFRCF